MLINGPGWAALGNEKLPTLGGSFWLATEFIEKKLAAISNNMGLID